ncbi:MAG: hypothetical protein Q8O64_02650 [Sideroxyarcus sp.]|nr:hypothetical protein [Sideroxyarcus sp.]
MNSAGRACPLHYRYGAAAIAQAPQRAAETLYVIGGLYGNLPALDAIETMAAAERQPLTLCFNGDFNWFNVDEASFREINERVLRHHATLGNVEAELRADSAAAGCGCAYPDEIAADFVERSNRIHARLKDTAMQHPDLLVQLAGLPMFARYRIGTVNVGVVHGDAESLAGWRFDTALPHEITQGDWLHNAFEQAAVDVFASTHTCLPALRHFTSPHDKIVINNGAAGMPDFAGTRYGLLTRISRHPSPHPALYGVTLRDVHIDALPIHYDSAQWLEQFLANWPENSPAWRSYFARISKGVGLPLPIQ